MISAGVILVRLKLLLNNRLCDAAKARVSVFDHGFLYGDGIYETVRAYNYRVFRWGEHFERFHGSARALGLKIPSSKSRLFQGVIKVLRANKLSEGVLRISLSRGRGPLGLSPTACQNPTLLIQTHPARNVEMLRTTGVTVSLVKIRRNPAQSQAPGLKALSALNLVCAKMEAEVLQSFEGIMLNLDGHLTEGTSSNLFFFKRGVLYTPAPECGLLLGITRQVVIELARRSRIPLREGRYTFRQLTQADEVFLTSSGLEIMPVVGYQTQKRRSTGGTKIANGFPGPRTRFVLDSFRRIVHKELRS